MGRLQTFDDTVVVRAARDIFWDKGFDATSLPDLEAATGLGRSSLYHAFGSKRGLFDAAVSDYLEAVIQPRLATLRSSDTDAASLIDYFDRFARSTAELADDSPTSGCLLVNCAAGLAAHDDPSRAIVEGYRVELADALRQALTSASARAGDMLISADELDTRVRTLASLSLSAMLMARVNRNEAIALLNTASTLVRGWFRHADR
jgi:AcrR family transcriptional regulator